MVVLETNVLLAADCVIKAPALRVGLSFIEKKVLRFRAQATHSLESPMRVPSKQFMPSGELGPTCLIRT